MIKKRINSKRKGNAAELELSKILTERFGVLFARVGVSSGARPKQVKLDDKAAETFTGDLIVPEKFRFSIECKAVNKTVDYLERSALLDKFLQQATTDAASIGKLPMVCWKRNRKGWLAVVPVPVFTRSELPLYCGCYNRWFICKLETLLEADSHFWFEEQGGDCNK